MTTCTITRKVPIHKVYQFVSLVKQYDGRLAPSFTVDPKLDWVWASVTLPDVEAMKGFDQAWRDRTANIVEKTRVYSRWQRLKNRIIGLLK
jgi:hypothetical protein